MRLCADWHSRKGSERSRALPNPSEPLRAIQSVYSTERFEPWRSLLTVTEGYIQEENSDCIGDQIRIYCVVSSQLPSGLF